MRVLQLIDSLRPGGAERMAVNYANALEGKIDGSFLCCTRMEGQLKEELRPEVKYLFLKKKAALDLTAIIKLRNFVKENKIDLIQAHSSSWFLGLLIKSSAPKVKLVWHDHSGVRAYNHKPNILLKFSSKLFDAIISVNTELSRWAAKELYTKNVRMFFNFISNEDNQTGTSKERLGGNGNFKIICVSNFRPQKDHINLLEAFRISFIDKPEVSLHLIGKFEEGTYFRKIKDYLFDNQMDQRVYLYGEKKDILGLLKQAHLGVLSSKSEGLPLALLEYGLAGLPVVCTAVGECTRVLENCGTIVEPENPSALANALNYYYLNPLEREKDRIKFQSKIRESYTEDKVISQVVQFFKIIISQEKRD